jgi:hypothetical protein
MMLTLSINSPEYFSSRISKAYLKLQLVKKFLTLYYQYVKDLIFVEYRGLEPLLQHVACSHQHRVSFFATKVCNPLKLLRTDDLKSCLGSPLFKPSKPQGNYFAISRGNDPRSSRKNSGLHPIKAWRCTVHLRTNLVYCGKLIYHIKFANCNNQPINII